METQFAHKIKCIRTDDGGEYCNHTMVEYLTKVSIVHQITCPYTPQKMASQNANIIKYSTPNCALLLQSRLPYTFWIYTLHTTTYLINRLPSTTIQNTSPYQKNSTTKLPIITSYTPLAIYVMHTSTIPLHTNLLEGLDHASSWDIPTPQRDITALIWNPSNYPITTCDVWGICPALQFLSS